VLIILFAAGLVSRAILFLQSSNDLGSWNLNDVYDLTRYRWLTQDSQSGRFLAGIFGWDPRPSIEQVIGYLAYLIPVLYLFFRKPRPVKVPAQPQAPKSTATVG
jgi:high-affinity iron transporter